MVDPIIHGQGCLLGFPRTGGAFQFNSLMTKIPTRRAEGQADSTPAPLEHDRLTRRERGIWRVALLLLSLLAIGLAIISWSSIRSMQVHLEALPIGLIILVALFVVYAWNKTNEIA